ncbi:hypothetical protein GGH12_002642 [Coemansia sp. RSA 1822]|nr:hypothetical protein GGH12_002642 [Coemansia sp. RSA 1822]
MRTSTAGTDPSLEHANQSATVSQRDTESTAASETTATDQNGSSGSGNNTRSFRFLLTLALRKAQTAVTLDNGGHVDEAIRTYREAISMLGLVLNRTNEEDGRQRLLHFRQTYSDRVSVLSSLRPTAAGQTETVLGEGLESQGQTEAHHYHTTAVPVHSPSAATHIQGSDAEGLTADTSVPEQGTKVESHSLLQSQQAHHNGQSSPSAEVSPISIPEPTSATYNAAAALTSSLSTNGAILTVDLPPALGLGPDEHSNSPVDTNKPLPLLANNDGAQSNMRKYSVTSNGSAGSTSQMSQTTADNASTTSSAHGADKIHGSDVPDQPDLTDTVEETTYADGTAPNGDQTTKSKRRGKDSEKASRRQSIKSQRSLPAMFGIGLKSKNDSKVAPPVPPIPAGESSAPKFGRRFLGALRSTQNADSQSGRTSASRGNSEDISRPVAAAAQSTQQAEQQQKGSFSTDRTAAAPMDLDEAENEQPLAGRQAPVLSDIPPPTPAKDSPPTPAKAQLQSLTLTREQKRQSNAAHRLAGLFKRKPSIPDIPSPALPSKYSNENSKIVMAQSPPNPLMLPKDRRLSASASTPNLFEAAAVAATSDQPAMTVFAATERGVLPPMPAPPTMRPSMSVNSHPVGYIESIGSADAFDERPPELATRAGRGGSVSDAASTHSGISRLEDKLRRRQQPQSARPALKISTKSASDMLGFVPEDAPLPSAPLTAGANEVSRSRKSSIATTNSQTFARGFGSMPYSAVPGMGAPLQQLYGRPTLVDVEEDQRSEMFEPSFGTFHTDLGPPPPKSSPLSPLWFINTLHRSMVSSGAYLTTSMYIPRRLWFQSGIRITAIETKLGVLAQLTQSLVSINHLLTLPDIDSLLDSATPKQDERRVETVPWESEENRGRTSQEHDELHKSCVALHHWLNNLEDTLESSRRLLGKKLKFINPLGSTSVGAAPNNGAPSQGPATSSNENLQASISHLPFMPSYLGSQDGSSIANASFPNLALSSADISNSNGVPVSPLSPGGEPVDARLSETQVPDMPSSLMVNSSLMINSSLMSSTNLNREMLSKDPMSNARFKGLGKLGKSVDRIYSNIQKEKLDDTSAYVAALQRFFEAAMALESIMHYFSRIAGDSEMAGWFTEVPQSPISLSGKRNHTRGQGDLGSISAVSPSMPHTTLTSEPSMSSINSNSERKSSNASISLVATATEKKNRRRSNYFSQRQNSNGMLEGADPMPTGKLPTKARGESFSVIPRLVLSTPAAGALASGSTVNQRFVLAPSPIKNPANFVHQGRGRAPGVIYARLVKLTEWVNQVILAWVVRDLQVLYAKYIKRLREWVIE